MLGLKTECLGVSHIEMTVQMENEGRLGGSVG